MESYRKKSFSLIVSLLVGCFYGTRQAQAGGALSVHVVGTNSLQAILSYTAPNASPCTVMASASPSLSPLVHDVDPALFAGSNSDGGGNIQRFFVVGKRKADLALDGNRYSRALQTNTAHYFQVSCGSSSATGTFTTANIPVGKTFAEPMLTNGLGTPVFPTVFNVRGYPIIDPLTGILMQRLSLDTDTSPGNFGIQSFYDGGFMKICSDQKLTDGGYYCVLPTKGSIAKLYWINATDGSSHFLGVVGSPAGSDYTITWAGVGSGAQFDSQLPNVYYTVGSSQSGRAVLLMGTYVGGDSQDAKTDAKAPFSWVNLTPAANNQTLTDLFEKFDSRYNPSVFGGCRIRAVQQNDVLVACMSGDQNSAAWLFAVSLGNKQPGTVSVVGGIPQYAHPATRWCGLHAQLYTGDSSAAQGEVNASGNWQVTLQTAVNNSTTTLQVSGEPTQSGGFLQAAAPGDYFQFQDGDNEIVQIIAKNSPTSWIVQRGAAKLCTGCVTPNPQAHAAGVGLVAMCNTATADWWWDFESDPRGTQGGYFVDTRMGTSHRVSRPWNGGVDVNYYEVRLGNVPPDAGGDPPTFALNLSPPFAGIVSAIWGNSYQGHPSYDQVNAPPPEQQWWLDVPAFRGGMYSDFATHISNDLYQYNLASNHQFSAQLPYYAISNTTILRDISGPGSVLSDQAAGNYEFCIAGTAGECVSGSAAGNIYFNVPSLAMMGCNMSSFSTTQDICVQNTAAFGEQMNQFGLEPDVDGGPRFSRALVSSTMLGYPRIASVYSNARPLPDGSWALMPALATTANMPSGIPTFAVKLPPYPEPDGIDRTNYLNVSVVLPVVAGATSVRIDYGYEENGPRASHYCTQRAERCSTTGTPGTLVTLQGIPQRILFFHLAYLNSNGADVADYYGAAEVDHDAVILDPASSVQSGPNNRS